jgi:class 3 adenylate cyclase
VGVRVARSFAFVDLCGFTHFVSARGDDEATDLLAGFRGCVRGIASRRGVRVAKWLGDGAMVVAVEPSPLVAAILEIEARLDDGSSALPIRAGMATGAVILFEGDDYIGTPVNLAARLCDVAGPRQVLAVPDLVPACPPWVTPGEPHRLPIAGFPAPVDVVRLTRRPPGEDPVTDPVCGLVLPADAAIVRRADGREAAFCSDSCAAAWADGDRPVTEPVGEA